MQRRSISKEDSFGYEPNSFTEYGTALPDFRPLSAGFTTPHDRILAEMFSEPSGISRGPAAEDSALEGKKKPERPPLDVLESPFDGSRIGTFVRPDSANGHPPLTDAARKNEELWTHLSKVLDLQNQMAQLHVDMEGIGSRTVDYGRTRAKTKKPWTKPSPDNIGAEEVSGTEDDGVDKVEADEDKDTREREEEFARLAEQLEARKGGIEEMMSKLDDLSKALTEFHALQAPKIEFPPSRHSSAPLPETSTGSAMDSRLSFATAPQPRRPPSRPFDTSSSLRLVTALEPGRLTDSPISLGSLLPSP